MARTLTVCALLLTLLAGQALATTAVIFVSEEPYYTTNKASLYPGASLKRYYAPLPVFFEGWRSSSRGSLVDYEWDFKDGSPTYHGFNAAHVFEKPGIYFVTLTVTDKTGLKSTATMRIDVLTPGGKTYYVDSEVGADTNSGLSPEAPWRTATQAFLGMTQKRYKPGDRILFKRGQSFDFEAGTVLVSHYQAGYGYTFGAYGEGPKPIIQRVGDSTLPLIKVQGVGMGHLAFTDLEIRNISPEGIRGGEFMVSTVQTFNIAFLRVDFNGMGRGLCFNGDQLNRRISGIFVQDCSMVNSDNLMLYMRCARLGVVNSTFDHSNNHIAYFSYLDKGVVTGNAFRRPAFGRVAMRIDGTGGFTYPSNNVCVTDNYFEGWIDPMKTGAEHGGGGVRYNYLLVDIGPNTSIDQAIDFITFSRNQVVNAETLLSLGAAKDITITENLFQTEDAYPAAYRIRLGHSYERRPLKNVYIMNNTFVSNEYRSNQAGTIAVLKYTGPEYLGSIIHTNLRILNNVFEMQNNNGATAIYIQDTAPTQIGQVYSNDNLFYAGAREDIFQIGGTYNSAILINMPSWRAKTGEDTRSMYMAGSAILPSN